MKFEFENLPFFDITPDLVCIADKDGFFKKINRAVIEKLEFTEEELFSSPISSFIHPDDKSLTASQRKLLLEGKPLINFQNRYLTKSGKIIWLHWTSIYFAESEVVFAIAKDVTERKIAENEIEDKYRKFKSLATYFKTSIEKDKKYMAVELHEELAQLASIVKMDLDWLGDNLAGLSEFSRSRLEHAMAVSEMLVKSIRRISFSISPNMLDDLGLNETLKWLCTEFYTLKRIPSVYEGVVIENNLSHELKLDLFRICQEMLNNVIVYGEATTVNIKINHVRNNLTLRILVSGDNFNLKNERQKLELVNITKRIKFINGNLSINTLPGAGTEIITQIATLFYKEQIGFNNTFV